MCLHDEVCVCDVCSSTSQGLSDSDQSVLVFWCHVLLVSEQNKYNQCEEPMRTLLSMTKPFVHVMFVVKTLIFHVRNI